MLQNTLWLLTCQILTPTYTQSPTVVALLLVAVKSEEHAAE